MFCRLNEGIAYCASPPTCQVLLLDVPFILLIYKKKGILFLILVPPTPSPLLSCLPSHLASSSVTGAIHTSCIQKNDILFLILVPPTPSPLLSCLPSHLASSSVRGAIHTSYTKRKSILCLILLSPTPSPLLSCLPSHLASSSVRGAIHTSYMKRNSIFVKENYKSAKCNIAFELKRLLVNQRRIHLLT